MIQEDSYIPKYGIMRAKCHSNQDVNGMIIPNIEIGITYTVDYVIMGRSWSKVCLSEFPELEYNTILFTFLIDNEEINLIWDYRALKRLSNDTCRETTLMICNDSSEDRMAQIRTKHDNMRIITRSEILQ